MGGKAGRWVARLVAHLLDTAALWVRIQTISKKYKMGDINKGVANTLLPAKKYTKIKYLIHLLLLSLPHTVLKKLLVITIKEIGDHDWLVVRVQNQGASTT